jgi:NADH dehydrogenase
MRIAVTGASSYSGKYIARRLLGRSEDVINLSGHPQRPDPFQGRARTFALDFSHSAGLARNLAGAEVLVNTYWVRFDRSGNTQAKAVKNTGVLVDAAKKALVKRIVHISITNPSMESQLPYFRGKAENERLVVESGMSYAILRPTVLFGREDILINNIAWLLRKLPIFGLPGDGSYRLSPVHVDDLAVLAEQAVYRDENQVFDAVGPQEFTFREVVSLIGRAIGCERPLIPLPPRLALRMADFLGGLVGDVMLTADELEGLMANLLTSREPPRGRTSLADWLAENRRTVGAQYASELARHY